MLGVDKFAEKYFNAASQVPRNQQVFGAVSDLPIHLRGRSDRTALAVGLGMVGVVSLMTGVGLVRSLLFNKGKKA